VTAVDRTYSSRVAELLDLARRAGNRGLTWPTYFDRLANLLAFGVVAGFILGCCASIALGR
jgi:hypothetical protein